MPDFSRFDFASVVRHDGDWHIFDLTEHYDPERIRQITWGIGRYNEQRRKMYLAPHFEDRRNIHMGIDFWMPAGEPVYAFYHGEIRYLADNAREGDYGPTLITRHELDGQELFALYGHLSRETLHEVEQNDPVQKGEKIGEIGSEKVNGGWVPHLHFQLSLEDPGRADMPGVVAEEVREEALQKFPDPRLIVGDLY